MSELAPQLAAYANDPWAFLCDCCFTRDQVDMKRPVKPFPREWDYLHLYVKLWAKHRRLAVPKSRRMFMSWCNIGLYLWAALFSEGQDFAFVSKKEDDAAELVKRAEFIYDNIPRSKIPRELLPRKETKAKPAALIFPDINSKIQGFPMGADQLRSYTFSGILGDECAFWEEAQKFYSASVSTTEGGGRMTLISSRHPGFFQRLVYDRLDDEDALDETKTPTKLFPFKDESVVIWQNPGNKFLVFNLHYTANPNKRSPEFRESVRKSMPRKDFLVEYETEWNVYDGKPVFEDYSPSRHEQKVPLEPYLGLPLLIGWDFGLTPAAVVAQLRDNTLFILREFTAANKSIDRFAPHVMQQLKQLYPEWADQQRDFRHYIDPAGLQEAQTDQRTCAGVMAAAGLRNIAAGFPNNTWEPRRKAVEKFLLQHSKDGAGLQLYPPHCPVLSKGFVGGYRYPDKYGTIEPKRPEPIKDLYSHPHDALQYLCGGACSLLTQRPNVDIPVPYYEFQRGEQQQAAEDWVNSKREYGITAGGQHGS